VPKDGKKAIPVEWTTSSRPDNDARAWLIQLLPRSGRFLRTVDFGPFNPLLSHISQVLAELKVGALLRKRQQPFAGTR